MNAFGTKTGFRGLANKLRDQAKDVVGNVKLPSFDEMAKNDEYIHSPDFKVRGAAKPKEEPGANDVSTTTLDEASNYSTESSWSLLDRPLQIGTKNSVSPTMPQQTVSEPSIQTTIPLATPSEPTTKKPAGSLLSVVSDALQPTTPIQQNRKLAVFDTNYDDDDSDQSSQDFDVEDPILFSMRKDQENNSPTNNSDMAPASVITIQKSSNRFLDDVRLQTSVDQDEGFDGIIRKAADLQTEPRTPLGGFFKNSSAIQNFQRMVLRKSPQQQKQQKAPPPLSRERPTKPQNNDEEFQIEASTSVGILGDDELQRLNQLKLAGRSSSAFSSFSNIPRMIEYLGEHKHSLFVLFTLMLCVFVYFRKAAIIR